MPTVEADRVGPTGENRLVVQPDRVEVVDAWSRAIVDGL
jgi:hypothetical protein